MVVGLSGVGKTSLIQSLPDNWEKIRSSKLLENAGLPLFLLSKKQFDTNQGALKAILQKYSSSKGTVILDGHLVIESSDKIFDISEAWFDGLTMRGIICITDAPTRIAERRNPIFSKDLSFIQAAQKREVANARQVGRRLNIPIVELHFPDKLQFQEAVTALLHDKSA